MKYHPNEIEAKWQKYWKENQTFLAENQSDKPKYYVLDMFPYPSGAGLHVGHPLGYIASDIYARFKRHQGFNVLHPMGYDSFGLPAEQYAIQTGQHPAITTETNIKRYREQLDKIGFSFDWSREVRTSEPEYYRWTQWIFLQLFNAWYNRETDRAEHIDSLIKLFEKNGNLQVHAACDEDVNPFSAADWKKFSSDEQQRILLKYRLTYLAESEVNWCPALGTVLANDEVVNGLSERGGHPVVRKKMTQWSMRISAYAERLLSGLNRIDWPEPLKEMQRNWIGKSVGAHIVFDIENSDAKIRVFSTRPDTIFGVSFMVLAPEHELVAQITAEDQKNEITAYVEAASRKSERERMADVKTVSGAFTGAYAIHPFSKKRIPIWIGDYVLAGYGTGAVMAVPCGDQRDYDFAKHFDIEIPNIFEGVDISEAAFTDKEKTIISNSDFLNGLSYKEATQKVIAELEKIGTGSAHINYRLRDAVFSRQRYWGEPIPMYYKNGMPHPLPEACLPLRLPEVEKYLPTEDGDPPLGNATAWFWDEERQTVTADTNKLGGPLELNTMPGWAGSSWYFNRYMDAQNTATFAGNEALDYWREVDLYIGGSEHATGHLLYSRFWQKFLFDLGLVPVDEYAKKLINQGMILGESAFIYKLKVNIMHITKLKGVNKYVTNDLAFRENILLDVPFFVTEDFLTRRKNKTNLIDSLYNVLPDDKDDFLEFLLSKITIKEDRELLSDNDTYGLFFELIPVRIDISLVNNSNELNIKAFSNHELYKKNYQNAVFFDVNKNTFKVFREVEKMSKSKYNVVNPDDICEQFGADTLRMYEMFLGPLEQAKPWNTAGITGVFGFLKKLWRLYFDDHGYIVTDQAPDKASLKTLHKTIKKVTEDIENFSFNTSVSSFMIAVNELTSQNCHERAVLEPLAILISPYAPHIAEELWYQLGHRESVSKAAYPVFDAKFLVEAEKEYPVSFNGKMRFSLVLPLDMTKEAIEETVLADERTQKQLQGRTPKKVIVVPGKIVNLVI